MGEKESGPLQGRSSLPRSVRWGIAALIVLFIGSFGALKYYSLSQSLADSASESLKNLAGGVSDLRAFDAASAEQKFNRAGGGLPQSFGDFFSGLKFLFGSAGGAISDLESISSQGTIVAREVQTLENNGFDLVLNGGGEKAIGSLKNIKNALDAIGTKSEALFSSVGKLSYISPDFVNDYLPIKWNVESARRILDAAIGWLDTNKTRHLIVFLGNPSEVRPGGGFLGSYADVAIRKGSIEAIEVHDVNDADRLLDKKTIPPKPLQALVANWRAADANWFFNFPDSAERVLGFLEASGLYAASSTSFDGAIALTPRVVTDILGLTGPIRLPDVKTPLDENNFLITLQNEVQIGQNTDATYPKKALKEFSSALMAKIKSLGAEEKRSLAGLLADRFKTRDLELYFRDQGLEDAVNTYGLGGAVSETPPDVPSDYLAVVDANIEGGKSDLYMQETVSFESQLNLDGTVSDHLSVTRKHNGNQSSYWWYKVTNQDYLQVFTPKDANLASVEGGSDKKITPKADYAKAGYVADDLVTGIESSAEKVFNIPSVASHLESDKKVFSTWIKTISGAASTVKFDYTHRLILAPTVGMKYEFIFDRQPGATRHYVFQINAPVGFRFEENGLPVYRTETDDPTGTLKIDLTLEKI